MASEKDSDAASERPAAPQDAKRRGSRFPVLPATEAVDAAYLSWLTAILDEWNGLDDCAAYDKL